MLGQLVVVVLPARKQTHRAAMPVQIQVEVEAVAPTIT
jgi:hypothetical protein